ITLSHWWGDPKMHPIFCTYRCNVDSFLVGIAFNELPKSFQDAVIITRELGIRYLWIDSLCIIQQHRRCSEACGRSDDWNNEAPAMGRYYSSSYLTLAATSAQGSSDGFLGSRPQMSYVTVANQLPSSDLRQHDPLYICQGINDFQNDVNLAELNQRAWVFQERALSRRITHFASTQTYWECGGGDSNNIGEARCETLAWMQHPKSSLLCDPLFPDSVMERSGSNRIRLLEALVERYTKLDLTFSSDRPFAIAGLMQRMAVAMGTEEKYSAFERFLARSLLWRRGRHAYQGLVRTSRPSATGDDQNRTPSWLRKAYEGEIKYREVPFGQIAWSDGLFFPLADGPLVVLARVFLRSRSKLVFDQQDRLHDPQLRCVIIGESTKRVGQLYVMAIAPLPLRTLRGTHERVGVGCIPKDCVGDQASIIKVI
ncbi:heterokaryon incompatibility protein-domain-containing protein, partial [Stachybotrys elegans]